MGAFQYVSLYSDRLDAHRFGLRMDVDGVAFMVPDERPLRLAAAIGWAL